MRIGLIADIHGNLVALDAVLKDLEIAAPDRIVCLGDVAALGPQPAEVIGRLRQIGCPVVMGNTDAWLIGEAPSKSPTAEIVAWCREQLGPEDLAFVRAFTPTVEIGVGARRTLLACHGSPRSYNDVISATTPETTLGELGVSAGGGFVVGGHTHVQLVRRIGANHFINPGSTGLPGVGPGTPDLPINRNVGWAEYAVLHADDRGHRIDLRRIPVEMRDVFAAAEASGMPGLDWWRTLWASETES